MKEWKKTRAIHLVCISNKFGATFPDKVDELKTYQLLSDIYDSKKTCDTDETQVGSSDAEEDRTSERQLKQHLNALLPLIDNPDDLSEKLIKEAHHHLMKDLSSEGHTITAGFYRENAVHAGNHTFIRHEDVPASMTRIIKQYNERFEKKHNSIELASWLLMEMLQIHPFQDGNGRLSRLLWCYSLMRDGLPFPVIPFPGRNKAYKQYIKCIQRDQDSFDNSNKHMNSLTLISITMTWKNFIINLKLENPTKYDMIITWLKESGNMLKSNYDK